VRKEWEEAKRHEDPRPPSSGGSSLQVAWLRGTHDDSNYILLRIPLEIRYGRRGEKALSIATRYLPSALPISQGAITRLQEAGLILESNEEGTKKPPTDYRALAQQYREMVHAHGLSNQTELARHLGVSRVWVSRVLKGITRK
jgi:hypothetical protein